jgi:hypothetical protein
MAGLEATCSSTLDENPNLQLVDIDELITRQRTHEKVKRVDIPQFFFRSLNCNKILLN